MSIGLPILIVYASSLLCKPTSQRLSEELLCARKEQSDLRARTHASENERLGDTLLQGFPTVAADLRDAPTARKKRSDLRARNDALENERLGDTLLQSPPRCFALLASRAKQHFGEALRRETRASWDLSIRKNFDSAPFDF